MRVGCFQKPVAAGFWLSAIFCLLGGCEPNILLGARPADEAGDAFGGNSGGGSVADSREIADRSAVADGSVASESGALSDSGRGEERAVVSPPPLLWFADHETSDLSAWLAGGAAQGGGQYQSGGQTEVSMDRAHSGSYSVKLTIDTTDGTSRTARLFRRAFSGGAYYSAWFWFPQAHTPTEWWSIFLFRVQRDPNDLNTFANVWDIDVERQLNGSMTLAFFDHLTGQITRSATLTSVPVGQWTHIEAYFNYAPPNGNRITVWQDGDVVLDLARLGQAPSPYFYWSVGTGSNGLAPPVSTIYLDDAAISTVRLGLGGGG